MANKAGATIGIDEVQPPIGLYVQDATEPAGNTNYVGVNTALSYATDVLGIAGPAGVSTAAPQPDWIVPMDDNAATGGTGQWTKNGAVALVPTDKVTIASGVATKDNATGTHNVFAAVPANYFFWAVTAATT
jgi:hypothetical protein